MTIEQPARRNAKAGRTSPGRTSLVAGASLAILAMLGAGPAQAQAEQVSLEQVVVTGSRVQRDGYRAPTPLTVVTQQELAAAAPLNIADLVNDLPSLAGSFTPQTTAAFISAGVSGVNALSLRALGTERTLVLVDGQRTVPSTITGAVDVNTLPQGLIRGVEIVTGGASAAYGSDAVAGVVNFILDKDFTGVKGVLEGGVTTHGDDQQYRGGLTAGLPFRGGRGKLLLNAEFVEKEGVYGVPRKWNDDGWYIVGNPAYAAGNGQPEWLVTSGAGLSTATPGGVITAGPLRGTAFGQGGAVYQQTYGATRDPWMIGGDWRQVQVNDTQALDPDERRRSLFGRLSYDLTDDIEVFVQGSWARHASLGWTGVQPNMGNVTIQADNAFVPASVRAQLAAQGLRAFTLGTTNADLPIRKTDNARQVWRYVAGVNGRLSALGTDWRWDAAYVKGRTRSFEMARDVTNTARLALAQDAVVNPANGQIVCRSTLTAPTNGCVPFNRLGIGVNTPAALAYVLGNPWRKQFFSQEVVSANLAGSPFSTWAGPVSLAIGAEHRKEKVTAEVPLEFRSGWFSGNYLPTNGAYSVTEGYLETVVPLATGLEVNGAVRATDYSTSGYVTTWKLGASYQPIPDIRLRGNVSRDIRAPNLNELYAAGTSRTNQLIDPFANNAIVPFLEMTTGNPALEPEKADNFGLGVVLQPYFLPGFAISADYFDISIKNAIGQVFAQTIVDRCFRGIEAFCAATVRTGGALTRVSASPFNFTERQTRGIDFEASYRFDLAGGDMTLRGVGTYYIENYTNNGVDPATDRAGENSGVSGQSVPRFIYRTTATWGADPWTVQLTGRGVSSGTYDNAYVTCASGCPASTAANRTINRNHIAGAAYVDLAVAYKLTAFESAEVFAKVDNLFNKDPAIVAWGPAGSAYALPSTNPGLYDMLGRVIRAGVRFQY